MRTEQAIVAIGGRAQRLRDAGIDVRVSKSFLEVGGRPILYRTLTSLYAAGVRRLVLCATTRTQLHQAERVLSALGLGFADVWFHQDEGLGVHGLPFHVHRTGADRLDERFIFECGHSVMRPEHYRQLDREKTGNIRVVFSASQPHPSNPRQPVHADHRGIRPARAQDADCLALAHPLLIDRSYAYRLPRLGFDIHRILAHYAGRAQLGYVRSELPLEFDTAEELAEFRQAMDREPVPGAGPAPGPAASRRPGAGYASATAPPVPVVRLPTRPSRRSRQPASSG